MINTDAWMTSGGGSRRRRRSALGGRPPAAANNQACAALTPSLLRERLEAVSISARVGQESAGSRLCVSR